MPSPAETVQQLYADFGKGNIEGIVKVLADDVSWIHPGYPEIPFGGKRKGKTQVTEFFTGMLKALTFTRVETQQFLTDGNFVTVKGNLSARSNATGKTADFDWVMLWEVSGGKVKSYQAFIDTYKVVSALK